MAILALDLTDDDIARLMAEVPGATTGADAVQRLLRARVLEPARVRDAQQRARKAFMAVASLPPTEADAVLKVVEEQLDRKADVGVRDEL